jgi:hypothetical protein
MSSKVHAMMGYNEDTLDLQSTTDYFSKATRGYNT